MKIISSTNKRGLRSLFSRNQSEDNTRIRDVQRIVDDVRHHGDSAVRKYARRFDKLRGPIELSSDEIREKAKATPPAVRKAIKEAARHIRRVSKKQIPQSWRTAVVPGVIIEQRVTPLDRVGCYVPGGRYPLPSSLLMTAIPAKIAGVSEILVACPNPAPAVLAAAMEAKVTRLFKMGGAHAIGAFAYGTRTVPSVDKIVGPGSAYVSAAKAYVAADCPIDFYAGPTEIVVVSQNGRPDWIASDLIAQAEHDPEARAILVTPNRSLATAVRSALTEQLQEHPAAKPSIDAHGIAIVTKTITEAVDLANAISPEHAVTDTRAMANRLVRAGTVFVGPYAAQAAGEAAGGAERAAAGAARATAARVPLDRVDQDPGQAHGDAAAEREAQGSGRAPGGGGPAVRVNA